MSLATRHAALAAAVGDAIQADRLRLDSLEESRQVLTALVATTGPLATLSGQQTIDGRAVALGNIVLVKNQADAAVNGLYVMASGTWPRAAGADTAVELAASVVRVLAGNTQGGTVWTTSFRSHDTLAATTAAGGAAVNWYRKLDTRDYSDLTYASALTPNSTTANNTALGSPGGSLWTVTAQRMRRVGDMVEVSITASNNAAVNVPADGDHVNQVIAGINDASLLPGGSVLPRFALQWGSRGAFGLMQANGNITVFTSDGYGTAYTQAIGTVAQVLFSYAI